MNSDFSVIDGTLTLPPDTRYLRSQEFAGREDLLHVIVPPGVGFMEDACFSECPNLLSAELPEGLVNIGPAAFAECPSLSRVNIPSTVTSIDVGAFYGCGSLRAVELPQGLVSICELAFQSAGLESISVPASVEIIEESAFFSCEQLRRADVLGAHTRIARDAFGSNYALVEGYIAPGYPEEHTPVSELLYTLLWCSCPQRHGPETCARAETFIRRYEGLIMERILKANNVPAMTGLASRGLLSADTIDSSLSQALLAGQTELAALLLKAKSSATDLEGEFEL